MDKCNLRGIIISIVIFLILIGLSMILSPKLIGMISESWKSSDATEPSLLYIWSIRFGGIIFALVRLANIVIYLLK